MSALGTCSECGAPIPLGPPEGLCGKCLFELGLEEVRSSRSKVQSLKGAEWRVAGDEGEEIQNQATVGIARTEQPGERIGRYQLLEKLGEGGFGVVYLAQQTEPVKRQVALKIIKLGMDTRQIVARFEAERQTLALMDHPNIAKIFDGGATEAGRPYFVMELVRGTKITDYCDRNALPTHQRLQLFMQVCRAIQHAHQKGIIHRDIKPSNILLTADEVNGEACPKVIDFGIAKATQQELTGQTVLTSFGHFLGTPAYMSPEQAEMRGLDIDTRTDIYSLGVLLYDLLTGHTPFETEELVASGLEGMRRTICEKEPPRPSTRISTLAERDQTTVARCRGVEPPRLIHAVNGDLDWIVMKCLEKGRARRYETANGLAADIERHLNNEPVVARPPSRLYEFQKTVRRHKFGFAATAVVIIALSLGIIASLRQAFRAQRAEREQTRLRLDAEKARNQLSVSTGEMEIREIRRAEEWFEGGEVGKALSHLAVILRQNPNNYIAAQRLMSALTQLQFAHPVLPPLQHADRLTWGQFSRDGRFIVTTSADATARVWDSTTGQLVGGPFRHEQEVNMADFSPGGQRLVTASMDKTARVWDIGSGEPLTPPLVHEGDVWNAHFSPDGNRVVTASADGTARVWEIASGQQSFPPLQCKDAVHEAEFSPGGERVLTASMSGIAQIWDSVTGQLLLMFTHTNAVRSAHFSPDGKWVLTGSTDATARVWDAGTGHPVSPVIQAEGEVRHAEFSPDGRWVATASGDSTARVWDARTGLPICPPLKHPHPVRSAHFSPDGLRLVTTSGDTAWIWDARTGLAITRPLMHEAQVFWAEFHPDGRRLFTVSSGTGAQMWDSSVLPAQPMPLSQRGYVHFADFSPDGKMVVTTADTGARIWDTALSRPAMTIIARSGVNFAAFSSDSHWLVTAEWNGRAQVWDAHSGKSGGSPLMHSNSVLRARFSRDGRRVVTASVDNTARVWDARTGQPVTPLLRHRGRVIDAQFSPDGRCVVTATGDEFGWHTTGSRFVIAQGDHAARIWDASSGKQLLFLQHGEEIMSVEFSPDGRLVLTSCYSTVHIWDAHTGREVVAGLLHASRVDFAGFSSDGTRVVTGSADGNARIWDTSTGKLLTTLATGAAVRSAQLDAPSRRLLTASEDGGVRVFDVETGLPITEVLKHNYDVRSATFSPDGHWLVTTVGDAWSAFIWDVPDYPLPVPAWVPELTEALAGQQVDAIGRPHFVSCERVLELKEKLQQAGPRQDAYTRWATWFFASAGVRSLSPNAPGLDKQTVSSAPAQISPAPHDNPGRIGNLSNLNTRISIPGLFNTGVGAGRSLLWENEIDRHYTYASGGVVQARPIAVQAMAGWLKDSDASAWIVPTTERFAPVGDYRYETKFDLSGLDPATAVVSGRWSCDNAGLDILINGRSTGQSNTLEFHAWTPFVISNAFVPGRNILAFLVNNAPFKNGEGNPTGMRVEMSGSAQREIPRSDLPNAPSLAQTVISARLPELPREPNASSTARIAIPGLFNTGVYDGGFPLVHSTLDHHYTYGPGSVGGGSPMAVNACRVWLTNSDGSAWIAPTLETMAPAGDYRYETEFDLSGLDPATAAVSGRWATDNAGSDILINGRSTGQSNTLQINTWTPFIITNGFVAGSNRLTFIVNIASPNGEDNPTGLRVEMSGTARRATPRKLDANTTARAHIHLFNSGEDDSGLRIDFDGTDTHYSYAPGSVASGRPTVITAFEQWLQDSETSTWIAPNAEPIAPVGNYHYQTEFDLVGLDPATAVISGKWATDNAGLDILINGQSTGQTNALEYRAWTPFHITNHFVPGRNTLTFIVTNAPEPPGALNPTGLRVEMSGTAEPLPAPVSQRVQR